MQTKTKKKWEEEFENLLTFKLDINKQCYECEATLDDDKREAIKDFISTLLSDQKKEIIKDIEKYLSDKTNRAFLSYKTVKEGDLGLAYKDGLKMAIKILKK